MHVVDSPQDAGLDPHRWQLVLDLAGRWCEDDQAPAIGLLVARGGRTTGVQLFGRQRLADACGSIRSDAIFLVASITKPVVATATLLLAERGLVSLGDRVSDFLPEFAAHGKAAITLRHLLTHTSGLPDMLPDNHELRAAHAPLRAFVERTCDEKPGFPAGRGVQYQSMGFAVLGEIIHVVTGRPCAEFVRDEIFTPLMMDDTALGAPYEWFDGTPPRAERLVEVRVPRDLQAANDWNWNSRYWRSLGAPWGGLLTTPADLARLAQLMLYDGELDGVRLLSPAAVAAATRNQLAAMPGVPDVDRRTRPWGFGWRLNWPSHSANFGDFLGPRTYGHWGATGTVLWIDPDVDAFAVILTTQPQEPHGRMLARLSNAIAAALV